MATIKKGIELDARIEGVVKEVYDDFKKYLPTPQDRAMYDRKQKEYWDTIRARLREVEING